MLDLLHKTTKQHIFSRRGVFKRSQVRRVVQRRNNLLTEDLGVLIRQKNGDSL